MDLIFWRHAHAEDHRPGLDDLDRELTAKGREQAKAMARWLKPRLPEDVRILVSPSVRTRQTADALKLPYEIAEGIAPDVAPQSLLTTAGWPNGKNPVLLVGHQPTLGEAAALVMTGKVMGWQIKKGAAWWLTGSTIPPTIRAVIGPDLL